MCLDGDETNMCGNTMVTYPYLGELTCRKHENPFSNTFSFDNLLYAVMNIFIIITLEGWTDMMYVVREAIGGYAFDGLFIIIVLFGAYFVMNLMIAVQFTYLSSAFDEEDREKKERLEKLQLK
jgi:hypothetical protein